MTTKALHATNANMGPIADSLDKTLADHEQRMRAVERQAAATAAIADAIKTLNERTAALEKTADEQGGIIKFFKWLGAGLTASIIWFIAKH